MEKHGEMDSWSNKKRKIKRVIMRGAKKECRDKKKEG